MNFKVNINEYVKVKLSDAGIKILRDCHDKLDQMVKSNGAEGLGEFQLKVDEEGYTKMQMWDFMITFSPYMHMGLELPFDANIIVTNGKPIDSWLVKKD